MYFKFIDLLKNCKNVCLTDLLIIFIVLLENFVYPYLQQTSDVGFEFPPKVFLDERAFQ